MPAQPFGEGTPGHPHLRHRDRQPSQHLVIAEVQQRAEYRRRAALVRIAAAPASGLPSWPAAPYRVTFN